VASASLLFVFVLLIALSFVGRRRRTGAVIEPFPSGTQK